jgi:hypothetical protein
MFKTIRNVSLSSVAAISIACSGAPHDTVDIGNRDVAVLGEKLSDFAGSWEGYAEAYDFEPSSDRIHLTLDAEGNGSVRFGDSALPPLPSDPMTVYPPDTGFYQAGRSISQYLIQSQPGFEYPVHSLTLTERRLRFETQPADMIDPWCALEPSVLVSDTPSYGCYGGVTFDPESQMYTDPATNTSFAVDALHDPVNYCRRVCTCTASGCVGLPIGASRFDGALEADGNEFAATLVFPGAGPDYRVIARLTRQTP